MADWLDYRSIFLDEFVRRDGLGSADEHMCANCEQSPGLYRCMDCHGHAMFCVDCLLAEHARLPLHRIEVRFIYSSD